MHQGLGPSLAQIRKLGSSASQMCRERLRPTLKSKGEIVWTLREGRTEAGVSKKEKRTNTASSEETCHRSHPGACGGDLAVSQRDRQATPRRGSFPHRRGHSPLGRLHAPAHSLTQVHV